MPKQPSRPGIPIPGEDTELGSSRHRACVPGRSALARTEQLAQRLDDHIEEDDDRLGALARDVEQFHDKVDAVSSHVGDLRVDMAKISTTVGVIGATLAERNEIARARAIAEVNAAVETGKIEKIAAIEDEADRRKARRAFLMKVLYAVVAAAGATLGALIRHFR